MMTILYLVSTVMQKEQKKRWLATLKQSKNITRPYQEKVMTKMI